MKSLPGRTEEGTCSGPCRGPIAPWRRSVQAAGVLLLLGVPFARPGGVGLLRIDIPRGRLEIFGQFLLLEQFHLLLLALLATVLLFLLATLVLGRLWCGWVCPQTVLSELVEAVVVPRGTQDTGGFLGGRGARTLLGHGFAAALALLVAANLVWYFLPPEEFFARLAKGSLGFPATVALISIALAVYIDLAFLRRLLCRDFCPYGRFQSALMDSATLNLACSPEKDGDCLDCRACVATCPTGIDIRKGLQVECIACGRCLDACRKVQARRGRPGLIRYRFGDGSRGAAALLNPRTLLLLALFAALGAALTIGVVHREEPRFTVSRTAAPPRALPDGRVALFYSALIANRSPESLAVGLRATDESAGALEIRGPVETMRLDPYERRQIDFALLAPTAGESSLVVRFTLVTTNGRELGELLTSPLTD